MRILIVLPYSGRTFGGGLAIFNAALASGLAENKHSVRVLTMDLPEEIRAKQDDHVGAELLFIPDPRIGGMKEANGSSGQADRNLLNQYLMERVKDPAVIAMVGNNKWEPDCIIGHSRFSGAAAISMKKSFTKAKAVYFVHSLPVEGTVLTGYKAFMETMSSKEAQDKIGKEVAGMAEADLIVPVGPLIRSGIAKIVRRTPTLAKIRIHECIGGTAVVPNVQESTLSPPERRSTQNPTPSPTGVTLSTTPTVGRADSQLTGGQTVPTGVTADPVPLKLLFLGRASEPIKGLSDLILAATAIDDMDCHIDVLYWDDKKYTGEVDISTVVAPNDERQARTASMTSTSTGSPQPSTQSKVGSDTTSVLPSPSKAQDVATTGGVTTGLPSSHPGPTPQGSPSLATGSSQAPPTTAQAKRQDSWTVDQGYAQTFLTQALGGTDSRVKITLKGKSQNPSKDALAYHALLVPSYIEHFGLVPFDALAVGVPVLVNQLSGAGMFLADKTRFPKLDVGFVVEDFISTKLGKITINPDDYLEHVKPDSFDDRHKAWASAISDLHTNWLKYSGNAKYVQTELKNYTWAHCGQALLSSLNTIEGDTRQVQNGEVQVVK